MLLFLVSRMFIWEVNLFLFFFAKSIDSPPFIQIRHKPSILMHLWVYISVGGPPMVIRADHYQCVETKARIAVSPWPGCEIGLNERPPLCQRLNPEDSGWLALTSGIQFVTAKFCCRYPPVEMAGITRLVYLHYYLILPQSSGTELHLCVEFPLWLAATSVFESRPLIVCSSTLQYPSGSRWARSIKL